MEGGGETDVAPAGGGEGVLGLAVGRGTVERVRNGLA